MVVRIGQGGVEFLIYAAADTFSTITENFRIILNSVISLGFKLSNRPKRQHYDYCSNYPMVGQNGKQMSTQQYPSSTESVLQLRVMISSQ